MKRLAFLCPILLFGFLRHAMACPTCGATGDPKKDSIVVGLLSLFILATYGVYYILFKIIYKHRNLHLNYSSQNKDEIK